MFIRWLRLLSVKVWFQYGSQGITSNHWHPEMHQEVIRIISQLLYQQVKLSLLMSCLLDQTDVVDLDCLFFSHDVRTTKLSSLLDDSIMSRIVNFHNKYSNRCISGGLNVKDFCVKCFLSPDGFKKCIRKKWTGVQKPWHEVLDSATPCDKRTSLHWIKELRYFGRVQFGVKVLELGVTDISHHFTKLLSVMKVTRCKLSAGGGVEASGHTDLSTTETGTQIVSLCYCWEYCVLLCFLDSFKKKTFYSLNLFLQIKHKYRLNVY